MKNLIFFDFCGTITSTNNTYDFLFFYFRRRNGLKFLIFLIFDNLNLFKSLIPFLTKTSFEIWLRKKIFWLLKNEDYDNFMKEAENFVDLIIKKKLFDQEKVNLIREYLKKNNKVMILSASIDPVIRIFFKKMNLANVEILSSRVEFRIIENKKLLTGKGRDFIFNKDKLLLNFKEKELKKAIYYTDNDEDKSFKNLVGKFIFLRPLLKKISTPSLFSVKANNYLFTYIPTLYYLLSRSYSLMFFFLNEFFVFFVYFKNLFFVLENYLTYLIFFLPIYEISSLYNDYISAKKEKKPTLRIEKGLRYNFLLFILIRIAFMLVLLGIFKFDLKAILSVVISVLVSIGGIVHSLFSVDKRVISIVFLRIAKLFPFYFFVSSSISIDKFMYLVFLIQSMPIVFYILEKKNIFSLRLVKKTFLVFVTINLVTSLYFLDLGIFFSFLIVLFLRYLSFYKYLRAI